MLMVVSPAKSLDFTRMRAQLKLTPPQFIKQSAELVEIMRQMQTSELMKLMDISENIAELNRLRFQAWDLAPEKDAVKAAVYAFNGDVYEGLAITELNTASKNYLYQHLRILSGLYGLLRPLDALQAYRLEMGLPVANPAGKNLYAFWGDQVSLALRQDIVEQQAGFVLNLASDEYFKVLKPKLLEVPIVSPVFQDYKNGQYKIISFYAKRARGLMARYCALHKIKKINQIKSFDLEGYQYCASLSSELAPVFQRKLAD